MSEPWEVNVRKVANGRNVYEVDVSKEDIATGGASQAEAEFFGLTKPEGEESMPSRRTREREGKLAATAEMSEEATSQVEVLGPNLIVNSPRHLWGLGSFKIHYRVADAEEMADALQDAQEFFVWAEDEFADRLTDVAALENQVTQAQKELLTMLAEETGEDLPDDLTDYSKTEASKLIQQLMSQRDAKPQRTRTPSRGSRRRPTLRSKTGGGRASPRKGRTSSGRSGSRRSGRSGGFNNDRPGSATDKQKDFLIDLLRQAGGQAPDDDELDEMTFNEVSAEINDLREALGYEDN